MIIKLALVAAAALAFAPVTSARAQFDAEEDQEFQEGDKVQIRIAEGMWQDCEMLYAGELMRMRCKPYQHMSGFTRAGGIVTMTSRKPKWIRPAPRGNEGEDVPAIPPEN